MLRYQKLRQKKRLMLLLKQLQCTYRR
jgi:hypothetical protein